MKYSLSKSRYCSGLQCPKMLWMKEHMPEMADPSCKDQSVFDTGSAVGDLAMGLFGDFVEVPYTTPGEMIQKTRELMDQAIPVIAEASFSVDGCFCSVDILRRLGDQEVALYEVKSATHVKDQYRHDAAFQYYVLEKLGYRVVSCNIVHLNNKYVRHGELDIGALFTIVDITDDAKALQPDIAGNILRFRSYMEQPTEPAEDIGPHCSTPYDCEFYPYCSRHLPKPSVFDLRSGRKDIAMKRYRSGIVSFADLAGIPKLSRSHRMQVDHEIKDLPPHIELDNLRAFMSKLSFPLYFFDFESFQPAIPPYDHTVPYQQVPFQYSLHYIEYDGASVQHKEFLAQPGQDPRRAVAERMCADIPRDVCILTYNSSFERDRSRELAALYPDLREHLLNIADHLVDLETPFAKKWYYCRAMQGRSSIKLVLPALFPGDPAMDYHNLEGVHQGGEASAAFNRMADMTPEEAARTRAQLLAYCGLDTLAMVKIWEKLRDLTK